MIATGPRLRDCHPLVYVLAVALAGNGQREEAIHVLEAILQARPNDANALQALASYRRESGQIERAAEAQRELTKVLSE